MTCATSARRFRLALSILPGLAGLACATEPPPPPASAQMCPPPPPPIYAPSCVLKKDVLDVADQILDENYAYESKLVKLEKSFQALQQDVARALEASLRNVASNQASVAIVGSRVRVRLSEELLFPSGSAQISFDGLRALGQVAEVLRATPTRRIEVAGHTDDRAVQRSWQDNWQLSAERARQVALILMGRGIAGSHLFIAGYADTDPADPADSDEARAHNRRVELLVEPTVPNESQVAPVESAFKPAPPAR